MSRSHAGSGLGVDMLAERFYLACAEFIEYPVDSRTLFLSIETVIAAFG